MNDYEYCFYEDMREKKRAATGAFHRATRGKRAFTVHNPSDNLTKKEWNAMSGEVREFQLKPMTWQEIKAMPEASQKSYLQLLIDEYGATFGNLAKMTGLGRTTVMKRFKELGVTPRPPKASTTKEERKRWSEFIGSENSPAEIIPAEDVAPTPKPRSIARSISEITLRSSNKGDLLRDFMELMEIIEGEYFTVSIDIR